MFSILKVLCASMSQKTKPPSRCNVLMLRNRYCKMVARVLCLVAREWVGSCQSWSSKVNENEQTNPHLYTMFWCRDIGLTKWLLEYSVWLLGSGLAAANHEAPKAACQYDWYNTTPMPLWHSEWKISLFKIWLLRCSIIVGDSGLAVWWPKSNEPTLMF